MHIAKFSLSACCAMILHMQRGREATLERDNIDRDRTEQNYEIGERFDYDDIKQVQAEVKTETGRAVRKDAISMADIVVTAPPNCRDYKKFFQAVYQALCVQLYANGLDQSAKICGYVHMDETTPHMHLCFIPVKRNKNNQLAFSFKTICKRGFYQNFHKDTEDYCERELGYRPHLLIVEDEDLNSLLSRADIDQKAYKELKDKLKEHLKADIKVETASEKAALDALKVTESSLLDTSRSLQQKMNDEILTQKNCESRINEISKQLTNLKSKSKPKLLVDISPRKKNYDKLNSRLMKLNSDIDCIREQKLNEM